MVAPTPPTNTLAPAPVAAPYPEHDKLGPLGAAPPVLEDPIQLRAAIVADLRGAATSAREAAASLDASPADAVHGARKALRRARALVAMVAPALSKSDRRAIRDALREGRRGLSTSRDHAVAPETLAQLPLGADDRATADRVLANAREAMPPVAEIEGLLADCARHAAAQADAFEVALPAEISWDVVEAGIAAQYAETRTQRRRAKRSRRAFHRWRRRSKELAYQLAFVGRHAGPRVGQLHAEIEAATDAASAAVDLVMLHEFAATYAQGLGDEAVAHLTAAIDAQLGDLAKSARKLAKPAYQRGASKFARRLGKAVRKDLAPPPAPEHDSGDEHS